MIHDIGYRIQDTRYVGGAMTVQAEKSESVESCTKRDPICAVPSLSKLVRASALSMPRSAQGN